MRRYYHNMGHEPVQHRTWLIDQETINEDDFKWLMAFNIPIRIEAPEQKFDTSGGGTYTVYGKKTYTCDTTTDKQRDMLILKYGNKAVLIFETVVLPGTMNQLIA